ncbi:MAG: hypothetical protein DWQ31_16400 [Planctomycetota bacterium]|nr:MAG: hypothetical protein DWQ31_16400 [Planctomycetota bacterium]REJ96334.1 MAG: hypothetical protein DWQ35_04725 [Planctomycetota bacterium]REK18714.1 MAG: hypothetical protein DWQ42_19210 [Planctomycetota bacterium]REK49101.1 MAG: hypothetical protein DWQ46_00930 [Planctomycetota bacterium]
MFARILRCSLFLLLAVGLFAAAPSQSEAQVGWYNPATGVWQVRAFRPLFPWRGGIYTSTFRPVVATTVMRPVVTTAYSPCTTCASPCTTCYSPCTTCCSPCTTCNMVAQTAYRPQIVSVPTTTYRAVQSCDACTGCCQTVLRPVTTMVQQVRQVAYTTYRPVCTTQCASPCATCGVVGCTDCSPTSCADGSCGTGSTMTFSDSATTTTRRDETPPPTLSEDPADVETRKEPTGDHGSVIDEPDTDPGVSDTMQRTGTQKKSDIDAPRLFNPRDRQAHRTEIRNTSASTKHSSETSTYKPVVWQVVK